MKDYQYTLDKSSKKHICPNCNKKKFVKYVDTNTGGYLPENMGGVTVKANAVII